jgi:hypothetical protein
MPLWAECQLQIEFVCADVMLMSSFSRLPHQFSDSLSCTDPAIVARFGISALRPFYCWSNGAVISWHSGFF